MRTTHLRIFGSYLSATAGVCLLASTAPAQVSIDWRTVDCGGGRSTGGSFTFDATIGQPDAGPGSAGMAGGTLSMVGGFWAGVRQAPACAADFDGLNGVTIDDLFLYLNTYFTGDPRADVNGIGGVSIDDLFLFLNAWFTGC